MSKKEIVESAIKARNDEIALYEVNISNYEHIIAAVPDSDADLVDFRESVRQLLAQERIELRKATLVLQALQAQMTSA